MLMDSCPSEQLETMLALRKSSAHPPTILISLLLTGLTMTSPNKVAVFRTVSFFMCASAYYSYNGCTKSCSHIHVMQSASPPSVAYGVVKSKVIKKLKHVDFKEKLAPFSVRTQVNGCTMCIRLFISSEIANNLIIAINRCCFIVWVP